MSKHFRPRPFDRTAWWVKARECEAIYGREFAEETWGTGYYRAVATPELWPRRRDDSTQGYSGSVPAPVVKLFVQREPPAQTGGTGAYGSPATAWKPSDGLAANPDYRE